MKTTTTIIGILVLFLITVGCSHAPVRETIRHEDASKNVFVSKNDPDLVLRPNSDFKFLTKQELYDKGVETDKYVEKIEQYVYVYAIQGTAKRILIIKFHSLIDEGNYTYVSSIFPFKHNLARGTTQLADGEKYAYAIGMAPSSYNDMALSVVEEGYLLPDCFMVKECSRIYGEKFNKKVTVAYFEDTLDSNMDCQEWEWGQNNAREKKYFLEGFIKRSKESFEVAGKTLK